MADLNQWLQQVGLLIIKLPNASPKIVWAHHGKQISCMCMTIIHIDRSVSLLPPVYEVRGKVMFWHASVCLFTGKVPTLSLDGEYLPWPGGVGIYPGRGRGYLPWLGWGTYLGWEVPTLVQGRYPPAKVGTPPLPGGETVLALPQPVCLLRSRRRTFLSSCFADILPVP